MHHWNALVCTAQPLHITPSHPVLRPIPVRTCGHCTTLRCAAQCTTELYHELTSKLYSCSVISSPALRTKSSSLSSTGASHCSKPNRLLRAKRSDVDARQLSVPGTHSMLSLLCVRLKHTPDTMHQLHRTVTLRQSHEAANQPNTRQDQHTPDGCKLAKQPVAQPVVFGEEVSCACALHSRRAEPGCTTKVIN